MYFLLIFLEFFVITWLGFVLGLLDAPVKSLFSHFLRGNEARGCPPAAMPAENIPLVSLLRTSQPAEWGDLGCLPRGAFL